jgi:transposase
VAKQPDITLAEIKAVLATEKLTVGRSSISRFLHHLKLGFKKVYGPPSRTAQTSPPHVRPSRGCSRG